MRPLSGPGRRERRHRGSSLALVTLIALGLATPGFGARTDREARRAEKRLTLEAARRGEYDVPTRYWREGPVRYLLSQDEDKVFRDLATPEVRVRFIKRFWAMRDPDPSSPGNPFRKLFYRRVLCGKTGPSVIATPSRRALNFITKTASSRFPIRMPRRKNSKALSSA